MGTLALQFEFLQYSRLSDPFNPRRGENIPHPDRIFQALISAAAETGQDFTILTCLESAPEIQAEPGMTWDSPKKYVPENFRRGNQYHTNALKYFPVTIFENPVITYIWKDVPQHLFQPIKEIAEQVTHIGRASSFVRGTAVPAAQVRANFLPDTQGQYRFRSPHKGRLDDLEKAYQAGLRAAFPPEVRYRQVDEKVTFSEWGELFVLRPDRHLDIYETAKWTDAMRRAVLSIGGDELPGLVHGHGSHRHLAWVAIPNVGHKYARGEILGLGCWLPRDVSRSERQLVVGLMSKVKKVGSINMDFDYRGLKGLQVDTWARDSRIWSTVTPMALPCWPKKKRAAEDIVRAHLAQRGLPDPVKLVCSHSSPIAGAPSAYAKKYLCHGRPRYLCHVHIQWEHPVRGPLLLGAERYFGGGLLRPLEGSSI